MTPRPPLAPPATPYVHTWEPQERCVAGASGSGFGAGRFPELEAPATHFLRHLAALAALLLLSTLLAGCLSAPPAREVRFYDLGPPPALASVTPRPEYLRVAAFESAWPARQRLVQRHDAYSVTLAEYERWVAPPETLLAARWRLAAAPWFKRVGGELDDAGDLTLEGRLLAFERVGEEAVLSLELTLLGAQRQQLWRHRYDERQSLPAEPANDQASRQVAALVALVDRCAADSLHQITQVLQRP